MRRVARARKGRERWREDAGTPTFLFLYRAALRASCVGRSARLSRPLVSRLSKSTARAHQIVYRQSDLGLGRIARTLMQTFPATVRAHRCSLGGGPAGLCTRHRNGLTWWPPADLILSLADSTTVEESGAMYDPANPAIDGCAMPGPTG